MQVGVFIYIVSMFTDKLYENPVCQRFGIHQNAVTVKEYKVNSLRLHSGGIIPG
jgi:hypothetical protein